MFTPYAETYDIYHKQEIVTAASARAGRVLPQLDAYIHKYNIYKYNIRLNNIHNIRKNTFDS